MKSLLIAMLACSTAAFAQDAATAKAELKDAKGAVVGQATLTDSPNGVLIHVVLTGMPAGPHAFHIHETGTCEAPFTSAGGHFNPGAKQHGMSNAAGMHAGDLPNVQVPADGALTFDVMARDVTLGAGANSLFKTGGTAIVMHAAGDDYKTNPAGAAGARIACGVIAK
jgi:Cu-Zn family superoxide dismutase